jgi:hypothetical protein
MTARRPAYGPCQINAAKTECDHGHPFDDCNTYRWIDKRGRMHRFCRRCNIDRSRRRRAA